MPHANWPEGSFGTRLPSRTAKVHQEGWPKGPGAPPARSAISGCRRRALGSEANRGRAMTQAGGSAAREFERRTVGHLRRQE